MTLRFLLLLTLLTPGCAHIQSLFLPEADGILTHGQTPLSSSIRPTEYFLILEIDPQLARFNGRVDIKLEITKASDHIDLHGDGLDIENASILVDGRTLTGSVSYGANGALRVGFKEKIPIGQARLTLKYRSALNREANGFYRLKDGDDWYVFSRLSPSRARRAFPCFDQPNFKTPFTVSMRIPKGMTGLGNAPLDKRFDEGDLAVVHLKKTNPLPTYLVAIAVGKLEVLEAPRDAMGGVPLRLFTTAGKSPLGAYALKSVPRLYSQLKDYVDRPYPFAKLDLVAVPGMTPGAMENPGLITFKETLLLIEENRAPPDRLMWVQLALAHELAHSYFGNLVTPLHWSELWLSEAFSTWMARRLVTAVEPKLGMGLGRVAGTIRLMRHDAPGTRPPVRSNSDAHVKRPDAGSGFEHAKGAAIIRMLNAWLGRKALRDGLRTFLKTRAYSTGTTEYLVEALDGGGKKQVSRILKHFLNRSGYPLLRFKPLCGPQQQPTMVIEQVPHPLDSPENTVTRPWTVPVCFRYGDSERADSERAYRQCFLMTSARTSRNLAIQSCPEWFHGNADNVGYYQWFSDGSDLMNLVDRFDEQLTAAEKAALPESLLALLEIGAINVADYMRSIIAYSARKDRFVLEGVVNGLNQLSRLNRTAEERSKFAGFVRSILTQHVERLGMEPRMGEAPDQMLLRPLIIFPLAFIGEDKTLETWAQQKTKTFLENEKAVSVDDLTIVLPIAARRGDDTLWTALAQRLQSATNPVSRVAILGALGSFEDSRLLTKTLELFLKHSLSNQDLLSVARGIAPAVRDRAWMWMTRHYEALTNRMNGSREILPWLAYGFCTENDRERVQAFFSRPDRSSSVSGRHLGQVIKTIDRCIRLRDRVSTPFRHWIRDWIQLNKNRKSSEKTVPRSKQPALSETKTET